MRASARRAYSRMPVTELWLSAVRARAPPANGKLSPTSLMAADALAVKQTSYASGSASRKRRVAARAAATRSVLERDGACSECGLPSSAARSSSSLARACDRDGSAAPV